MVRENTTTLDTAVTDLGKSVIRAVRTSTTEVERRQSRRYAVALPCRIKLAGGAAQAGEVSDLSAGGACISTTPQPMVGTRAVLDIATFGLTLPFVVRNVHADVANVAFELDAATTEQLRPILADLERRQAA